MPLQIIKNSGDIPMILVNEFGEVEYTNLDSIKGQDEAYVEKQLQKMKLQNKPVEVSYQGKTKNTSITRILIY